MISLDYYHPWSSFHISTCQFWAMKRCQLVSVVKLTTFLAPYEHVLITCCLSFQVFRGSVFCMCKHGAWCKFKSKLEILEEFFIWIRLGVLRIFKKLHFAWDSEDTFYGFRFTLRTRWRRICTVDWRSHSRHSPRFACLLTLFTLARIASRFDYSILATPK